MCVENTAGFCRPAIGVAGDPLGHFKRSSSEQVCELIAEIARFALTLDEFECLWMYRCRGFVRRGQQKLNLPPKKRRQCATRHERGRKGAGILRRVLCPPGNVSKGGW